MYGFPLPESLKRSLDSTKVDYVKLGSSGLQVSWPILGAMSFGNPDLVPWILDENAALPILKAAFDCGINTWNTAAVYSNGLSEVIIGKAIRTYQIPRRKLVLMTTCAFHVGEEPDIIGNAFAAELSQSKDYVNQGGLSRVAIFQSVEGSLSRFGTDYIDLLQIHRYDPSTPPEETMKALHDLVESGKVRYIGASSMWATQFAKLQFIAEKNGWTKFISMQNYYNLCYREEEREMIRFCKETGVGNIPWAPLFAGRLARPLDDNKSLRSKKPSGHHPEGSTSADEAIIKRVEEVASKKGWRMSDVALAWHKHKGTVPIVGLNSVDRVNEVADLRRKVLDEEDVQYLEEPYVPRRIAGHS